MGRIRSVHAFVWPLHLIVVKAVDGLLYGGGILVSVGQERGQPQNPHEVQGVRRGKLQLRRDAGCATEYVQKTDLEVPEMGQ